MLKLFLESSYSGHFFLLRTKKKKITEMLCCWDRKAKVKALCSDAKKILSFYAKQKWKFLLYYIGFNLKNSTNRLRIAANLISYKLEMFWQFSQIFRVTRDIYISFSTWWTGTFEKTFKMIIAMSPFSPGTQTAATRPPFFLWRQSRLSFEKWSLF